MTTGHIAPNVELGRTWLPCSCVGQDGDTAGGFAGVFGQIAQQQVEHYGEQSPAGSPASASAMQAGGARCGAVFNMGGAAVANDLSVLEAV